MGLLGAKMRIRRIRRRMEMYTEEPCPEPWVKWTAYTDPATGNEWWWNEARQVAWFEQPY